MKELTKKEKQLIEKINHSLYTVEYLEKWINRDDNVFTNAPAALISCEAKGFYEAIRNIIRLEEKDEYNKPATKTAGTYELIKRQDAINVVAQCYRYESDRITALQELPIINGNDWITDRLPECKKGEMPEKVQVTYITGENKDRTDVCNAIYIPYHTFTTEDLCWYDDYDDYDYCEEEDSYWIPDGWYETISNIVNDIAYVVIEGRVVAWQPLPPKYECKET